MRNRGHLEVTKGQKSDFFKVFHVTYIQKGNFTLNLFDCNSIYFFSRNVPKNASILYNNCINIILNLSGPHVHICVIDRFVA